MRTMKSERLVNNGSTIRAPEKIQIFTALNILQCQIVYNTNSIMVNEQAIIVVIQEPTLSVY